VIAQAVMLTTYLRARFATSDCGASMLEYGLLAALIAVVCAVSVTFLSTRAAEDAASTGG
jgi:Flp pilus assembly pilin Flp